MKVDLNTVVKCWDFTFNSSKEKSMPIVEFLNYLKNQEGVAYVQNKNTIDKWLKQGYIDTDKLGDEYVTLSRENKNTIEIWYEYFYDGEGDDGDIVRGGATILLPNEYDIPIPKDAANRIPIKDEWEFDWMPF